MCGLIAIVGGNAGTQSGFRNALQHMLRRGPDGEGVWEDNGIALGHRRLAILDLDPRAAQPMHSACGRYVIVFNGEIYNFAELRRAREAAGDVFHTTSDTEVLLALFVAEGEAMLARLRGMFAFVIWDRLIERGFAARDPYGIKPLYYGLTKEGVVLASQVKALLATGQVSREPDLHGQAGFWLLGSVPEPRTWYRDIQALPAGHCAWIEEGRIKGVRSYWDIGNAWRNAASGGLVQNAAVQDAVRSALQRSVERHLVSDVPVGVFLSGGIDSGALAGLMVEAGARELQGITIAYDEFAGSPQDEAPVAAQLAAHYGIRHHVRRVTRGEFLLDLPRILAAMDQPSIDGINTWYASKAVAELGLRVVVSGVGGDELFQGYESFDELPRLVSRSATLMRLPGASVAARMAGNLQARRSGNQRWRHAAQWTRTLPGAWWLRRSLHAPEDLPILMGADRAREALKGFEADSWTQRMSGPVPADPRLALGQIESTTYLRNQLLRDSDWASMDHSVELRTPLVDAWLLAEVQSMLPVFWRFPKKSLLAHAPSNVLPAAITGRRKTGFGIPVGRWLGEQMGGNGGSMDSRGWAKEVVSAYEGCP
ncbi:MAG: asparagine synthase (glutamine-hydrolyzing) [Arenimonas sp.]|uniref:asparagine synthase (glutamine-hydrolyzing) n=1 Tax=Arenimonas sp. TaxID=1872635 RepID=UPI0025B81767|nr:asparagine synthase (glutamine-hydrolyzing) [Arenimonas sp.]MBW8368912.1 asparagine synthase (glutamine-hydrolyzing) [Arenimonas sp.]